MEGLKPWGCFRVWASGTDVNCKSLPTQDELANKPGRARAPQINGIKISSQRLNPSIY